MTPSIVCLLSFGKERLVAIAVCVAAQLACLFGMLPLGLNSVLVDVLSGGCFTMAHERGPAVFLQAAAMTPDVVMLYLLCPCVPAPIWERGELLAPRAGGLPQLAVVGACTALVSVALAKGACLAAMAVVALALGWPASVLLVLAEGQALSLLYLAQLAILAASLIPTRAQAHASVFAILAHLLSLALIGSVDVGASAAVSLLPALHGLRAAYGMSVGAGTVIAGYLDMRVSLVYLSVLCALAIALLALRSSRLEIYGRGDPS